MTSVTSQNHNGRTEATPLLPRSNQELQQSGRNAMAPSVSSMFSWKAHPYWLIPVVLVMSMSRGVTMSPRIQVYKAIACRALSSDSPPGVGLAALLDGAGRCGGADAADIQARAAKIQAAVVTTMSGLSAITTGFWSRAGDRQGRKLILSAFLIGALLMEAVFVLVMKSDSLFGRHAEKFILVGPILEGLVGGLSTFNGVVHAYISDCTRHGSRSKIFSTVQGMVFVGLALGPPFAGLFLPRIGYSDSFFYTSIALIFCTLLYVIFICPESLTQVDSPVPQPRQDTQSKGSPIYAVKGLISRFLKALLSPILMFAPRRVPSSSGSNYSMPLVGLALFAYIISTGVYSAKYLYAQHVFEWTTAELGYYMSILWFTRAFNLLAFLPVVISYLKPKPTSPPGTSPNAHDIAAEVKFDRLLAQISVGVDGLADSLVALTASRSQGIFIALSCLSSFTSGGNPSLHSLGAVCLHACGYSSEVGTLFGAMGVLSAVAHIISPSIYATTYSRSVANFPEGIFVLAATLLFSSVLLLSRVRPDENEIALIHSRSRRLSTDRSPSAQRHSRPVSGSYSYEPLPASDSVLVSNPDEEEERQRGFGDGGEANRRI